MLSKCNISRQSIQTQQPWKLTQYSFKAVRHGMFEVFFQTQVRAKKQKPKNSEFVKWIKMGTVSIKTGLTRASTAWNPTSLISGDEKKSWCKFDLDKAGTDWGSLFWPRNLPLLFPRNKNDLNKLAICWEGHMQRWRWSDRDLVT